jgi:hypothetical protein
MLVLAVVCIIAIIGIFASVFLQTNTARKTEVDAIMARLDRLEIMEKEVHAKLDRAVAVIPQPSQNSTK